MRIKKLFVLLSLMMSAVLLISGCEYDPSLVQNAGSGNGVTTGTVLEDTIIRSGPGEDFEEIEYLTAGEVVVITGEIEDGYYPVNFDDNVYGYVASDCLEVHEPEVPANESQTESVITATVIDNINIRRGPGQDYELIERIGPGAVLTIIGEEENGYYPVDYNGEVGYAHRNFIEINEQPVVVQTETAADGPITIENNEAFAEILAVTDPFDARIGQFVNSHIGDTIEFDGYMGDIAPHGSYSTRYDFLVCVGDSDGPVVGPEFHFTDYNLLRCNLMTIPLIPL